jgi:predicted pyridoxine 5'-phosphate oxidase superfamily flavin-nucleotide-binding protein
MTRERPLSADAIAFIAQRDSAYLATANTDGQPYVQHRGGPAGFLRVLDDRTIAFADYAGNRQYVSVGNLKRNDRAFMFLMDYAEARRLKLWGHARVVRGDPALLERVTDAAYAARIEHVILFTLSTWEWNCSRHIPKLVPA